MGIVPTKTPMPKSVTYQYLCDLWKVTYLAWNALCAFIVESLGFNVSALGLWRLMGLGPLSNWVIMCVLHFDCISVIKPGWLHKAKSQHDFYTRIPVHNSCFPSRQVASRKLSCLNYPCRVLQISDSKMKSLSPHVNFGVSSCQRYYYATCCNLVSCTDFVYRGLSLPRDSGFCHSR